MSLEVVSLGCRLNLSESEELRGLRRRRRAVGRHAADVRAVARREVEGHRAEYLIDSSGIGRVGRVDRQRLEHLISGIVDVVRIVASTAREVVGACVAGQGVVG